MNNTVLANLSGAETNISNLIDKSGETVDTFLFALSCIDQIVARMNKDGVNIDAISRIAMEATEERITSDTVPDEAHGLISISVDNLYDDYSPRDDDARLKKCLYWCTMPKNMGKNYTSIAKEVSAESIRFSEKKLPSWIRAEKDRQLIYLDNILLSKSAEDLIGNIEKRKTISIENIIRYATECIKRGLERTFLNDSNEKINSNVEKIFQEYKDKYTEMMPIVNHFCAADLPREYYAQIAREIGRAYRYSPEGDIDREETKTQILLLLGILEQAESIATNVEMPATESAIA